MTPEKMISVIEMYEERLCKEGVQRKRMDTNTYFADLTVEEHLAHAYYLCDGVKKYARDPKRQRKAGSHLTSVQYHLGLARWYTLAELMDHNRPDED